MKILMIGTIQRAIFVNFIKNKAEERKLCYLIREKHNRLKAVYDIAYW